MELRLLDGEPVEPTSLDATRRRELGKTLAAVPLVSLDTSIELTGDFERELLAALELASEWQTTTVRVFGGTADVSLDAIARRLEPALARADELGVTVALETHDGFASARRVAELLRLAPIAAVWDIHHPHRVGESPQDVLAALGPRIALVHVKDAAAGVQLVPLGTGEVPVRESIALLEDAGYDGWLTVEWEKRWHPELDEPEVALPRELATLQTYL